jgi:hypothetical protein
LSGALTRAAGANVGTYTIDASALNNTNYTITRVNGALTITPRPITVTADAKSKIYGDADPTLTWAVTSGSLLDGDTLFGALVRVAGESVGTYAILTAGLNNANYLITGIDAELTILPARPVLSTSSVNVEPAAFGSGALPLTSSGAAASETTTSESSDSSSDATDDAAAADDSTASADDGTAGAADDAASADETSDGSAGDTGSSSTAANAAATAAAAASAGSASALNAPNVGGGAPAASTLRPPPAPPEEEGIGLPAIATTLGAAAAAVIASLFLFQAGALPALGKVVAAIATVGKTAGASSSIAKAAEGLQSVDNSSQSERLEDDGGDGQPEFTVESIFDPEATTCTTMRSDESSPLTQALVPIEHKPERLAAASSPSGSVGPSGPSLATFFGLDRILGSGASADSTEDSNEGADAADDGGEENLLVATAKERLQGIVEEQLAGLPAKVLGDAVGELTDKMNAVLEQFSVGRDVLAKAWKDATELVEYRRLVANQLNSHFVIALVDHQVSFDQSATLDAKLGEKTVKSFEFPINFTARLSDVRIEMQGSRIMRVHLGGLMVAGSISLGDRVLLEVPEQSFSIGSIDLGSGVQVG